MAVSSYSLANDLSEVPHQHQRVVALQTVTPSGTSYQQLPPGVFLLQQQPLAHSYSQPFLHSVASAAAPSSVPGQHGGNNVVRGGGVEKLSSSLSKLQQSEEGEQEELYANSPNLLQSFHEHVMEQAGEVAGGLKLGSLGGVAQSEQARKKSAQEQVRRGFCPCFRFGFASEHFKNFSYHNGSFFAYLDDVWKWSFADRCIKKQRSATATTSTAASVSASAASAAATAAATTATAATATTSAIGCCYLDIFKGRLVVTICPQVGSFC